MSVKLSEDIQVDDNLFMVSTVTKWFFISKPHSVVIPHILNGKHTASRGFLVEYATSDPEILQDWHQLLCQKVREGLFDLMLQQAHEGLFPFVEEEMHLAAFVKGFRCP
jgi:hypothetical protein